MPERRFGGCEPLKLNDTIGAKIGTGGSMTTRKENSLRVIGGEKAASKGLTRREVVQRLLAGAGAAWPLVAASHPIHALLQDDAILAEAEKLGAADWKPVFFNAQQNETLIALAESIVPGSAKARVNQFVDLLLSVERPENQRNFVESLEAHNAETQKRFGKDFAALDESEKNAVLTDASTEPENPATPGNAKSAPTLYEHFENLKGWVSGAYYSSEAGMRELGWTGDYVFEAFPGCKHPEGH